jgi:transcriptional regulator with XRE-family HTH domain
MLMNSFSDRLKEERERLGFNQEAFGAIGGVKRLAQGNYEKGERAPDLNYLAAISKVGADVLYIVTGAHSSALVGEDALLLEGFRKMDAETKRRTLAMVYGGTPPAAKQVFHGTVNQAIEGGAVFNKGVKFDLSDKK